MADLDLGPAELDLLEDALEDLELPGAIDRWLEDGTSPAVRERLEDYRSLLVASREALPLEDVRAGVLDDVIAEANRVAAVAPVAAASQDSWWSRVRRSFMMPALALAGTAALVLWVFDPEDRAKLAEPPLTPTASAPTVAADEAVDDQAPEEGERARELEPLDPPEQSSAQATPAAAPAPDAPTDEGAIDGASEAKLAEDADKDAKPKATGMGSLGDVPGGVMGGSKTAEPHKQAGSSAGPASGRWDIVARADRARQSGDCVAARQEYSLALEDDDPRVRARAFAGLGLCDTQEGNDPGAEANFERARELDGEVGGFIDSQQQRARPSKKRKPKASKSKKSVMLDDMNDPFSP
ncbi:hypothetical protein [Paraliomyxa miuraensis]|uniref:hypothetical protein n=1 Tax=Paraliomyxa miuraensis TaxID=376150 RepID=UPI00225B0C65|nr:hypothetical protein [Paraliomyxa miuraensis]MCX4248071.1 hypothetical protein [Paraliomyxa miuraensis]